MRAVAPVGLVAALVMLAVAASGPLRAEDGVIWRIGTAIGLAPGDVLGDTGLAAALAQARGQSEETKRPAFALHVTPEGHFEFAATTGETYTAGTPAELMRAAAVLRPGAEAGWRDAQMVLSTDSLFAGADALKRLPDAKSLSVAIAGGRYPAERRNGGRIAVKVARFLSLMAEDRAELREALAQLWRPIDARRVAILAVRDSPDRIAGAGAGSVGGSGTQVETRPVDADRLLEALGAIPRRTAMLTAKVAGSDVRLELPSGRVQTVALPDLTVAARGADLDLVVLDTDPPRQPGGRTWLFGRVTIPGAERAAKARRFQDVLEPLAEARGGFDVRIAANGTGSVRLTAEPAAAGPGGVSGWVGAASEAADVVTGEVAGTLKPRAIVAYLVPDERRRELGRRLIPGVPSALQWGYLGLVTAGLVGFRTARAWWRRLWPLERRGEYSGAAGYLIARGVRLAVFLAVFLPVAGLPAAVAGSFRRRRATAGA